QRLEHLVLADLATSGLHHEDGIFGARDHQLELRGSELLVGGIRNQLALDESHAYRAQRPREWQTGQAKRRGGADHGQDVRVVLVVGEITRLITWISLRKPFGKSGRMGRSMSRQVSVSFSSGRPSRLK